MFSRPSPKSSFFLLDKFSVEDIRKYRKRADEILEYYWQCYSELSFKRAKIFDQLKTSLIRNVKTNFEFKKWQRVLSYKYALEPLSSRGSLLDPGGRFNIGEIETSKFPTFPALYLAEDRKTSLQEKFCQAKKPEAKLSLMEMALAQSKSIVCVSLSGQLETMIDLTNEAFLHDFCDVLKTITFSARLQKLAKKLKMGPQRPVQTAEELMITLLDSSWRRYPMQYDVPANSQIFGQIIALSGINAIFYPSKFNQKLCLAIFPQTFVGSSSFVEISDAAPAEVKVKRLEASNCHF